MTDKTPTREELIELREKRKLTREQIAEHFDTSLSTVRRWIKEKDVPRPSKNARYKEATNLSRIGEIIAEPDDGMTLMERAQHILGDRLTEKRGYGYMLDGKPASTQRVVQAAGLKFHDE